jgi:hypothetical protein
MRQPGRSLGLTSDPLSGVGVRGDHHLHRHVPFEHLVVRPMHRRHAATAKALQEPVAARKQLITLHNGQPAVPA